MVLGGSGGSRIFPSLAQVLLNVQCGLNLSEAVERPRVHNQIVPPVTTLEVGPGGVVGEWKDLVDDLKRRGHEVGLFDINIAISEGESRLVFTATTAAAHLLCYLLSLGSLWILWILCILRGLDIRSNTLTRYPSTSDHGGKWDDMVNE